MGNAETLLVALTHVLENGIRVTPTAATLTVRVRPRAAPGAVGRGGGLALCSSVEVDDDGPGIEPDVLPRLFEPFMTTRDDRQAIGLGLFIAQSIAREHGGWLEGSNKPPGALASPPRSGRERRCQVRSCSSTTNPEMLDLVEDALGGRDVEWNLRFRAGRPEASGRVTLRRRDHRRESGGDDRTRALPTHERATGLTGHRRDHVGSMEIAMEALRGPEPGLRSETARSESAFAHPGRGDSAGAR